MTQIDKMKAQGYLTIKDVADTLGVHVTTIYRLIDMGRVEGVRIGRARYVKRESVLSYYSGIDEKAAALLAGLPAT